MKTFVSPKQSILKFVLFVTVVALSVNAQAQPSNEMNSDLGATAKTSSANVKLVSFTVVLNTNKADLKWVTASEVNLSHFIIEKSTDGINFSDAGVFFAYGNATDKTNYSFSDKFNGNQAGTVYYRLFFAGNNGKGQYSETVVIKTAK